MMSVGQPPGRAKRLAIHFGLVTAKEFGQRVGAPLLFMAFVILGLLMVDIALYTFARFSGVHLESAVWGTYAAWASAILPTIGIVATVGMWLVNQFEKDAREALNQAILISVEKKENAVASILNQSAWPLEIVAATPSLNRVDGQIVRPQGPRLLLEKDTRSVTYRIRGVSFEHEITGALRRIET